MRYGIPAFILLLNATAAGASRERLVVCSFVEDPSVVDWSMLTKAKLTAAAILKQGGVELKWSKSRRPLECAKWLMEIKFSERTPDVMLPGAMGYAPPYATGPIRVTVFLDRLWPVLARTPNWRGSILGHVIAHELTHVLQGIARHADQGLMKARWSEDDFQQMGVKPLGYTPADLRLLRSGMARHDTLCEE
jgi:hypothetical protein